jgi:hypothetical protein
MSLLLNYKHGYRAQCGRQKGGLFLIRKLQYKNYRVYQEIVTPARLIRKVETERKVISLIFSLFPQRGAQGTSCH